MYLIDRRRPLQISNVVVGPIWLYFDTVARMYIDMYHDIYRYVCRVRTLLKKFLEIKESKLRKIVWVIYSRYFFDLFDPFEGAS